MTGNYFIKIDDATDLRRRILESSKGALHGLRAYHELIRIRGEKLALVQHLRHDLKELTILINRVEALTPVVDVNELTAVRNQPTAKAQPKSAKVAQKHKGKKIAQELPPLPMEKKVFFGAAGTSAKKQEAKPQKTTHSVDPLAGLEQQLEAVNRKLSGQ